MTMSETEIDDQRTGEQSTEQGDIVQGDKIEQAPEPAETETPDESQEG